MKRLWALAFGHWPLKLAALGLATVLYAGVALSQSAQTWPGPVPIEVLRAPAGGALLELPGVVEEIRYQASQEVSNRLAADSFRASIDLSGVEPRVGADPVPVRVDVFPVDPSVRVIDYLPRSVNVRLDQVVSRGMPVTIEYGAIPEGIELGQVSADPRGVTVRGASSRLQNVRTVAARILIDASGINVEQDVAVEAFDELGALVPGVEIEPASVRVSAEVARQSAYATLPIVPRLSGEPARGHRVESVSVEPPTITVSGEEAVIRQLETIPTVAVDVAGQDADLASDVAIELPDDVTTPDQATVRVLVSLVPDVGSRRLELGTALVDASADLGYRLEDVAVSVVVTGALLSLDDLEVEQLIAEVPVGGLDVGTHDVVPVVTLPSGLAVAQAAPDTVRVTVSPPS